jgi:hypothetical protein
MGGACGIHGTDEKCIQSLMGIPDAKRPHSRRRHKWKDNIKVDCKEM